MATAVSFAGPTRAPFFAPVAHAESTFLLPLSEPSATSSMRPFHWYTGFSTHSRTDHRAPATWPLLCLSLDPLERPSSHRSHMRNLPSFCLFPSLVPPPRCGLSTGIQDSRPTRGLTTVHPRHGHCCVFRWTHSSALLRTGRTCGIYLPFASFRA